MTRLKGRVNLEFGDDLVEQGGQHERKNFVPKQGLNNFVRNALKDETRHFKDDMKTIAKAEKIIRDDMFDNH